MNSINNTINGLIFEKKIRFKEGANFIVSLLQKAPAKISSKFTDEWYLKDKEKQKIAFGVITLFVDFIFEFLKKLAYILLFVYLPYKLIGRYCPNVLRSSTKTYIYFFTVMSVFCGSVVNNTMFRMSDNDYIIVKIMNANIKTFLLGRILYKMITEAICFSLALMIIGAGVKYSIILSFIAVLFRPFGEVIGLIIRDYLNNIYVNIGTVNGVIMAGAFLGAYLVTYTARNVSDIWFVVGNPITIVTVAIIGVGSMFYLWKYNKYESIKLEIVCRRRDEMA